MTGDDGKEPLMVIGATQGECTSLSGKQEESVAVVFILLHSLFASTIKKFMKKTRLNDLLRFVRIHLIEDEYLEGVVSEIKSNEGRIHPIPPVIHVV